MNNPIPILLLFVMTVTLNACVKNQKTDNPERPADLSLSDDSIPALLNKGPLSSPGVSNHLGIPNWIDSSSDRIREKSHSSYANGIVSPEYYYNDSVPAIINDSILSTPWVHNYFTNLKWKEQLNKSDVDACLLAIDSTPRWSQWQPNPIMPLLVHRDYSVLKIGSLWQWDAYRKFFLVTKNFSNQMFDQYLLNAIDPAKLEVMLKVQVSHYSSIDDKLLDVLVIRQCKRLRKGLPVNVVLKDRYLNIYQRKLLSSSILPNQQAIDSLLTEILHPGQVLTFKQSASLNALASYGRSATEKALTVLYNIEYLKNLEKFGIKLLMDVFRMRASTDLTKSEQIKLLNYIEQEKIYNGVFVEDKGSLVLLKSMLTGLPREQCLNDFGLYQEGNHIKNVD